MKLVQSDRGFELKVLGHEFPNAKSYHDANWLKVQIKAQDGDLSWEAEDNCLLAYELGYLLAWADDLPGGAKDEILFTENELGFGYDREGDELIVILDMHFHPKGEEYEYGAGGDEEYHLRFPMDERKLQALTKDIQDLVNQYPVKGQQ